MASYAASMRRLDRARSRGRPAASRPCADAAARSGSTWAVTCVGQRGHLPVEPVPAGDLEGDPGDLPGPARRAQRPVDAADLEHEDPVGAALDRPADRDRVHDAAVEVVLAVDLGRAQQPGDGGRRHHRVDDPALGEPVLGGPLDAGRAALERHRELGEGEARRAPGPAGRAAAWPSAGGCRCGRPGRPGAPGRRRTPRGWSTALSHSPTSRSITRRVPGRRRPAAPLSAPTEVPRIRSGRTRASNRARSMPTSTAPSRPPPPRTKAVRHRRLAQGPTGAVSRLGVELGARPRRWPGARPRRTANGTVPHSSVTSVKPMLQRACRESRKATSRKTM